MNPDGTSSTAVFDGGPNDTDLAWSPCGDQFAFTRTVAPGESRIMLLNEDGSDLRELTSGEQPSWSPDCSRLAFIRPFTDDSGIDVWTVNADGSGERKLTLRE
jgi:Tol biopolymer transport system component